MFGKRSVYNSTSFEDRNRPLQRRKVLQKITVQNHEIGHLSFCDCAKLVTDPERLCRVAGRRRHDLRRGQSSSTEELHFVNGLSARKETRVIELCWLGIPIGSDD